MGSVTNLRYHLILTTKYRRASLAGVEDRVYEVMHEVEAESSFRILAMGTEHGNHIHMVIKAAPTYSVASIVNRIKGMSQARLWASHPDHLSRFYWGPSRKLWHGAYYCDTVGNVAEAKILDYVTSQDGPPE